ncbi:MAG: MarR family transcriptional regulator [Candidatus Methanoplasma sp.]|jgi:DNA-binding MarR family transcriptional regulator|nr:MarR family transcriptional regulator [Candidatus Methanoplasma sp.]
MNDNRKLAVLFVRLGGLLLRYRQRTATHGGMNFFRGQGRVLAVLKIKPTVSQKELGYLLDMSKQALAGLLKKLEEKGYIARTQSDKDRRSYDISLTDAGRRAIPDESTGTDCGWEIEEIFDCLNSEERQDLTGYLERIIGVLRERVGEDRDGDYAEFCRERFFARHMGDRPGRRGGFGRRDFDPREFGRREDNDDEY